MSESDFFSTALTRVEVLARQAEMRAMDAPCGPRLGFR